MTDNLIDTGKELIEQSYQEQSIKGQVEELFPYIFSASKKMSARKISRWLEEQKDIKISHVTLSKALSNSEEYLVGYVDTIYEAAETLEAVYNLEPDITNTSKLAFLFNEDYFHEIRNKLVIRIGETLNFGEIFHVYNKLLGEWFSLPGEVRNACENLVLKESRERYLAESNANGLEMMEQDKEKQQSE